MFKQTHIFYKLIKYYYILHFLFFLNLGRVINQDSCIKAMNQLTLSVGNYNNSKCNVNQSKNIQMNKSAILIDKLELSLIQQLPKYVTGSRRSSKIKTVGIKKGLQNQGIKNRTIQKIIQASIKQAMKQQNISEKSVQHKLKQKRISKKRILVKSFPRKLLNILYRQNIKNYNPYITVLTQLEDNALDIEEKDRIKRLCYIGVTRNYFQMKKYFTLPSYSRVGVLIRAYMIDVMKGNIQKKIQANPQSVFIPVNQTALSFNPNDRPKELEQHISKKKYGQILKGVNKIIESQYQHYKRGNFEFVKSSLTYSQIFMYSLIFLIIVCVSFWVTSSDSSVFFEYFVFFAILAVALSGMGIAWLECKYNIGKVCPPNNITTKIEQRINSYLKSVSDQNLTWKVGPDFYWIQIQNIKIKKRKNNQNDDIF